jgi:hypothetical protein
MPHRYLTLFGLTAIVVAFTGLRITDRPPNGNGASAQDWSASVTVATAQLQPKSGYA